MILLMCVAYLHQPGVGAAARAPQGPLPPTAANSRVCDSTIDSSEYRGTTVVIWKR